jgi:Holliday junction resolvase RusA-like endonuclease
MERPYKKSHPARLVIYCRSFPLSRGRINKSKQIYQPLLNQRESEFYLKQYEPLNIDYPVFIDVTFAFKKTGKHLYPVVPSVGDIDNHLKSLLDNLQRVGHLRDDRFVVGLETYKIWSTANYIDIRLWRINSNEQYI